MTSKRPPSDDTGPRLKDVREALAKAFDGCRECNFHHRLLIRKDGNVRRHGGKFPCPGGGQPPKYKTYDDLVRNMGRPPAHIRLFG